jgi:hypothetical protein
MHGSAAVRALMSCGAVATAAPVGTPDVLSVGRLSKGLFAEPPLSLARPVRRFSSSTMDTIGITYRVSSFATWWRSGREQNNPDPGEVNPDCSQEHNKMPATMDHRGRHLRRPDYLWAILGSNQ